MFCFFFQAEDGIRDLVRSRGLGDVYKRQELAAVLEVPQVFFVPGHILIVPRQGLRKLMHPRPCLLYTSDAADERSSVDLGGRRIIKKKNTLDTCASRSH